MFSNIKTLKIIDRTYVNSRFKRDIREAAPNYFFKFCIRVHSTIYLHCTCKPCKFTCTVWVIFFI
jgi:hypothetical protein